MPVAVLNETSRRVIFACPQATAAGVTTSMRETAALSRCPELHAEVVSAPEASSTWAEVLEQLYARYSDRVEGRAPGLAFLKVSAPAARELAAALHAPVGLAGSMEVAHLAALRAQPGEVRVVPPEGQAEKAFLALTPLAHLHVLGLTGAQLERLRFMAITGIADLWTWSAAQREAYLGVECGKRLNRFLKGERTTSVARYVPGQVLRAHLEIDAPIHELAPAEAVLHDLLPALVDALRGRTAAYLTVTADTVGGTLSATRKLKWPLDTDGLGRVARLALEETDALPLGIDRLTLEFSGLAQPSRMVGLWAGLADLDVTRDVLDRFPDALVRVRWLDAWSYATHAMYEWVDWQTGEVRRTAMTPRQAWTPSRTERRQQAVEQILAFFEGAQP
ncbi:Y-family DNA polymerase [Deinococcus hohokamensis]|uniref:Y-family DNA polymerase n=1 Tax=Deinococcus hohokamensis TaxID=309883 RepID=A0ABV9I830_9DEIO